MNQTIELQRLQRDEIVFASQLERINSGPYWKRRYDELNRFHKEQLKRETANCIEISVLRTALYEAQKNAEKWQRRCCEIETTTLQGAN